MFLDKVTPSRRTNWVRQDLVMIRGGEGAGAKRRGSVQSEATSLIRSRDGVGDSQLESVHAEFPGRQSSTHTTMNVNKPFVSLAKLQLPVSSRLLPSACCPDKDLVVTISPQNGKDHVSLWKMQGSKKWEVDVRSDSVRNESIVDLAWSPDGVLR
jgi:hypothetical protein